MAGFNWKLRAAPKPALDALAARVGEARGQALPVIGEYVRARSVAIAPHRTGALRSSASVETEGNRVRVGYHAPYAAVQHENTRFRHPNGGRAKYLSSVVERADAVAFAERAWAGALRRTLH